MKAAIIHAVSGEPILIDAVELQHLSKMPWYRDGPYFKTRIDGRWTYLHRLICGAAKGAVVDHISGNTSDNRSANLRRCTKAQNAINKRVQSNNKLGVKGVSTTPSGTYRAAIQLAGKWEHIGCFPTAVEAAAAYRSRATALHGEFAREAA